MRSFKTMITIGVVVFLIAFARLGSAERWKPANNYRSLGNEINAVTAHLYGAISKFEGRLHAYCESKNPSVKRQLFAAWNEMSESVDRLNSILDENYQALTEEQQLAVNNAYSTLTQDLIALIEEANSVLGEVFSYYFEDDGTARETNHPDFLWLPPIG